MVAAKDRAAALAVGLLAAEAFPQRFSSGSPHALLPAAAPEGGLQEEGLGSSGPGLLPTEELVGAPCAGSEGLEGFTAAEGMWDTESVKGSSTSVQLPWQLVAASANAADLSVMLSAHRATSDAAHHLPAAAQRGSADPPAAPELITDASVLPASSKAGPAPSAEGTGHPCGSSRAARGSSSPHTPSDPAMQLQPEATVQPGAPIKAVPSGSGSSSGGKQEEEGGMESQSRQLDFRGAATPGEHAALPRSSAGDLAGSMVAPRGAAALSAASHDRLEVGLQKALGASGEGYVPLRAVAGQQSAFHLSCSAVSFDSSSKDSAPH